MTSPFVLGMNLGEEKFIHAVLYINGMSANIGTNVNLNAILVQISVYIGNSEDYTENTLCEGSPFLSADFDDYYDLYYSQNASSIGLEAWCNLPG